MTDRKYFQVNLGKGIVAHQVTTALGFHWRYAVLSQERHGVQIDYGVYAYSIRAPQVILPVSVFRSFKGKVMKERREIKNAA
jgi:hypothetical protein